MKITNEIKSRISTFIHIADDLTVTYHIYKLSDLYNSHTTKYASIYDGDLFKIYRSQVDIIAAGYSKLCKAIIALNLANPIVNAVVTILIAEKTKQIADAIEAKELFDNQLIIANNWLNDEANEPVIIKEATKVMASRGRTFTTIADMNNREKRSLSYFLLKNFTNMSESAIYHSL